MPASASRAEAAAYLKALAGEVDAAGHRLVPAAHREYRATGSAPGIEGYSGGVLDDEVAP